MPKPNCVVSGLATLLDVSIVCELIPKLTHLGMLHIIELEVAAVIVSVRRERTKEGLGYRNDYRSRSLITQVVDLDPLIPIERRPSVCDNTCRQLSALPSSSYAAGQTRAYMP